MIQRPLEDLPLFAPRDRRGRLEKAYDAWIAKKPWVYDRVVEIAFRLTQNGTVHSSINDVFEELRRNDRAMANLGKDHCGVKVNNNHRSIMIRRITAQYPVLEPCFDKRRTKIQITGGPLNATLPPGDHRV